MAMLNNQRVHVKAWNKGRMHKIFIPVWHVAKENRRYQISQEKNIPLHITPTILCHSSVSRPHTLACGTLWLKRLNPKPTRPGLLLGVFENRLITQILMPHHQFFSLHIEKIGVHCTSFWDKPNWSVLKKTVSSQVILPGFPNGIPRWFWSSST